MQLTSLEICGFKSFADRTKFVFDKGITGIVGPNGCGKSNIVDSIRWALGEQRSGSLRSDKMENVIFNGTKNRKKANFAEVSLTFENTRNLLPTEYSTVCITRKLYRSGESEYLINGVACRLKDIHDLFMDTGISSDSYAIIELRMVDEILTNKDNERRRFFEEAAGISKYKIRKKQTLKKLEETDADLARVEDVLFEIDKNLKTLEKQARRTQRYFELKEQYRLVSSQYTFLAMRSIRERQRQVQLLEQQIEDQLGGLQASLSLKEARIQELKKELLDQERALSEAQADLNKHLRHIQSVETEKSIKNERLKYLQQRELSVRNQLDTEKNQRERNESSLAQLRESQVRIQREQTEQAGQETKLKAELDALKKQDTQSQQLLRELETEHRETEMELQSLSREKEIKKVKIQSLEAELARTEEDRYRREEDLDAFGEKARLLEKEVAVLDKQVADIQLLREQHAENLSTTETLVNNLKDAVYKTNRMLDARTNEYNLTKSLVENLEGFPASVKFLKKNAQWMKDAPLLSDILAVQDEYKVAFENYLEPYLSYYVVKTRQDAVLSIHMLADAAKGRANFFILDELEAYKPANPILFTQARPALDVVETGTEYKKLAAFLLDKVYLVPEEKDLPDELPEDSVFMTRAGGLSRRRFVLGGGSLGLFEGKRLGRAKNLESLEKEIAKLRTQLSGEKTELEQASRKMDELRRIDYSKQSDELRKQQSEKQRDLSVLQTREKEYREFLARVGQRSDALNQELESLQKDILATDPQLRLRLEELQQLTSRLAQVRQQGRDTATQLGEFSQRYNQEHIRLIHLNNQADNINREIEAKEDAIEAFARTHTQLLKDLEAVKADTDTLISSNLQDDDVIVNLYTQKKEKEDRVGRMEQAVALTKNLISQVEDTMAGERKSRESLLGRQAELRSTGTEIRMEINSLRERMSVEFQTDVSTLDESSLFDKPLDTYILEETEEKVLKIRSQVQGYGEINPMAVEAYQEMKERFDFIQVQKEDLVQAKKSLMDTMAEIDETAKAKFLETFEKVRDHFGRVFRSLFSEDDSCDLILMDTDNPLESDISIIARPKGKRPLTIKQLSGGEKTLTAVALLFSIYLIKPAPFCIFDEVDAPLDDANIDKFNNIIRDFSSTSQFIIVTHNKRTMAATQIMYGVTMESPGISRLLPVDMEMLHLN